MTVYVYEARNDVEVVYFLAQDRRYSDDQHQITEIARFPNFRRAQQFLTEIPTPTPGQKKQSDMIRLPDGRMMQFNRQRGDLWLVTMLGMDNRVQAQMTLHIDNLDEFKAGILAVTEGHGRYQGEVMQLLGEG